MRDFAQDRIDAALTGMRYPCERQELVRHATAQGADDEVIGRLCVLPEHHYADLADVHAALERTTHDSGSARPSPTTSQTDAARGPDRRTEV
ncbi:Protein of unknown function [Amycolatopsis marina]|uniref:DUF2795 domain-containing protein n=1 Tax=Amycolatopsis marina TaxID=490629 RepID=A0A1I1CE08_9PSEU|nr:DUF2795 domain-containing protein [Amycolatopsis marina]SFB58990.1 Protein of unknown function [Amycolatopsis marina]